MKKHYILFIIMSTFVLAYKILSYYVFIIRDFDYGIFTQMVVNGNFFNYPEYYVHGVTSHLGVHFQPILLIESYAYHTILHTVLISQVFGWLSYTLFGAEILYYTKKYGKNPTVPLVFWAFSPIPMVYAFDAHPIVLALPLIIPLIEAFEKDKWGQAMSLSFGLFLVKEDAGLILAGLAFYYALKKNPKKTLIAGVTSTLMLATAWAIIKYYSTGKAFDATIYGGVPILIVPAALISLTIIFISLGHFSGGHGSKEYAILVPLLAEIYLNMRPSMVVPGFQYFTYIAPVIAWILIKKANTLNVRKYVAVIAIISILFSPVFTIYPSPSSVDNFMVPINRNAAKLWQFPVILMNYRGEVYELHTLVPKVVDYYSSQGYNVCLGPILYAEYFTIKEVGYVPYAYTYSYYPSQCQVIVYLDLNVTSEYTTQKLVYIMSVLSNKEKYGKWEITTVYHKTNIPIFSQSETFTSL